VKQIAAFSDAVQLLKKIMLMAKFLKNMAPIMIPEAKAAELCL